MVLGTAGLPGSGKSPAAKIAEDMGISVITGGDIIRNEVDARDLPLTDENSAKVTEELRSQYGEFAIAEKCIEQIEENSYSGVLVDSFRKIEEVNLFQEEFGVRFRLLAITAPFEKRANRLIDRNRPDDVRSRSELRQRDVREIAWGVQEVIDEAEVVIENSNRFSEFKNQIRRKIKDYQQEM